ncbi:unnamed protein product [Mycena citricolor]|uniref:Shikimate dehydrogenase substrate binding N-terminal domain-containing protein n=1 Tax=Mycena citricolor TaxID=2018698 RepID=A0AAD2H2M1_9AGAR|nr:unnamed protein product [Mycena citricolor]
MSAPLGNQFYLCGFPIAHSHAPNLHNHVFKALGTDKQFGLWSTSKVTEEMLQLVRSGELGGAAVTMPIKTAIIPFLDELSPESQVTNACNTIVKVKTADGGVKLVGQNTDSSDFTPPPPSLPAVLGVRNALLTALREQFPAKPIPSDASAAYQKSQGAFAGLVIGGGATTRSAAHALTLLGLSPIYLINRDVEEVKAVVDAMPHLTFVHLQTPDHVEEHLVGEGKPKILMIVGCIPSFAPQTYAERMVYTTASAVLTVPYVVPTAESPVLPYPTQRLFLEMPYKPLHTTMFKVAEAHGWCVIDGIQAMIEQGLAQQRMWFRGVATVEVGSDSNVLGAELEGLARAAVREKILAPMNMTAIHAEVDHAQGKESAVPPKKA